MTPRWQRHEESFKYGASARDIEGVQLASPFGVLPVDIMKLTAGLSSLLALATAAVAQQIIWGQVGA